MSGSQFGDEIGSEDLGATRKRKRARAKVARAKRAEKKKSSKSEASKHAEQVKRILERGGTYHIIKINDRQSAVIVCENGIDLAEMSGEGYISAIIAPGAAMDAAIAAFQPNSDGAPAETKETPSEYADEAAEVDPSGAGGEGYVSALMNFDGHQYLKKGQSMGGVAGDVVAVAGVLSRLKKAAPNVRAKLADLFRRSTPEEVAEMFEEKNADLLEKYVEKLEKAEFRADRKEDIKDALNRSKDARADLREAFFRDRDRDPKPTPVSGDDGWTAVD